MHALGIAGDLGADHARGIGVVGRAAHPADRMVVEDLDLERAGRGAVMRAGGSADFLYFFRANKLVHAGLGRTIPGGRFSGKRFRRGALPDLLKPAWFQRYHTVQYQWSGFDIRYPLPLAREANVKSKSSTGYLYLLVVL